MSLIKTAFQYGPVPASLAAKKAALAQYVRDVLAGFRADVGGTPTDWIVTTAEEDAVDASSRGDRLALMAVDASSQELVRYAEIAYRGDLGRRDPDSPDAAHLFLVSLFYGVDAFTAAAKTAFEDVLEQVDATSPGLLYALRKSPDIPTSDGPVFVEITRNPVVRPVLLSRTDRQYEAALELTLQQTAR